MSIDWVKIRGLRNKQEIEAYLSTYLKGSNYGKGENCWTLTEIINERSNMAESALRIIQGVDLYGRQTGAGGIKDDSGQPLRYKLRVLTRQACTDDKNGKGINGWDTTSVKPENDNDEYCPEHLDPPLEGDRVWIKGDPMVNDPITGERLTKRYRMAMKARMEAELGRQVKSDLAWHYYTKAPVDKDGCIVVDFVAAMQLLKTKGKRLVLPQFKGGARTPEGKRKITNWLFEEVPPIKQQNNKPTNHTS